MKLFFLLALLFTYATPALGFRSAVPFWRDPSIILVGATSGTLPVASGTITLPTGLHENDLVFVLTNRRNDPVHTVPSGWTQHNSGIDELTRNNIAFLDYKRMGPVPDLIYRLSDSTSSNTDSSYITMAFRNVSNVVPFGENIYAYDTGGGVQNLIDCPAVSATARSMFLCIGANADNYTYSAAPTGFTHLIAGVENSQNSSVVMSTRSVSADAAINPSVYSQSGSGDRKWDSLSLLLNPYPMQAKALSGTVLASQLSTLTSSVSEVVETDFTTAVVSATISGLSFSINGGAWTSSATAQNGDSIRLRALSPAVWDSTLAYTYMYGGTSYTWTVDSNSYLNPFSFTSVSQDVSGAVITSNIVTLTGNGGSFTTTISGNDGEFSVNGGAWTSATAFVKAGDTLRLRQTAPAKSASVGVDNIETTTITVDGTARNWSVTTRRQIVLAGSAMSWVVPTGVTTINVVGVGPGGAHGSINTNAGGTIYYGGGGGGGGAMSRGSIAVTAGQTLSIYTSDAVSSSIIRSGTVIWRADGGSNGGNATTSAGGAGGAGGTVAASIGTTIFAGGAGGSGVGVAAANWGAYHEAGGGGGAGGYSGAGGAGANGINSAAYTSGSAGTGGAGGGGSNGFASGAFGGSTGVFGAGANGAGGTAGGNGGDGSPAAAAGGCGGGCFGAVRITW